MSKKILSGNEAVAWGAYVAGVKIATAYPGTPSTEILETLAKFDEVNAHWCTNEKVALDVASGASFCGVRSLVAMKHVGLNVASDALVTLAYTGVEGGLVVVSCDDPFAHSSQNEQDNRNYARLAKLPLFEPSDSEEAYKMIKEAFELSEEFSIPVLVRLTTRISHAKGVVDVEGRKEILREPHFPRDPSRWVMIPAHARKAHEVLEKKILKLKEYSEKTPFNQILPGRENWGIITSSIAYQYVKEAFPEAWILKIGFSYPLPEKKIKNFSEGLEEVWVIEELDPILEKEVKALGISVKAKPLDFYTGELSVEKVRRIIKGDCGIGESNPQIPSRPPLLCAGCPHRGIFYVLKKLGCVVTGDIGCYTLACLPPLSSMDTCVAMGSGVGHLAGMERAGEKVPKVAVIGDSTFFHAGIPPLIDLIYNFTPSTVIVLDNRTTAMTGHQDHPGTGITLKGSKGRAVSIKKLVEGLGVKNVREVDPYDLKETERVIKEELGKKDVSVIISTRPCVLLEKREYTPLKVMEEKCKNCGKCLTLGCPALYKKEGRVIIDPLLCTGCGMCKEVCPFQAIE